MPKTVPNQKIIIIRKDKATAPYSIINLSASNYAMKILDGNTFKFWYYLASNQNEFQLSLSSTELCAKTDMCRTTYVKCFKKLEEEGFLINNNKNTYTFYECPKPELIPNKKDETTIKFPEEKKQQIEQGFIF